MPRIEQLRKYLVAGMGGHKVSELVITPEAIQANRSFAVVPESQLERFLEDPTHIPLRLTQVMRNSKTELTKFKAVNENGKLRIMAADNEHFDVNQSLEVQKSTRPFYDGEPANEITTLLKKYALPFRVSKRSKSQRWAVDCGDAVAEWLSERIGERVRLVKSVKHPEEEEHHFTWYTDPHAVTRASLKALNEQIGEEVEVDPLTFRYNVLLSGDEAFAEETWETALLGSVTAVVQACERCGYIGVDRATGLLAQNMEVINIIAQEHDMNFGVYLKPEGDSFTIKLRVGDEIPVSFKNRMARKATNKIKKILGIKWKDKYPEQAWILSELRKLERSPDGTFEHQESVKLIERLIMKHLDDFYALLLAEKLTEEEIELFFGIDPTFFDVSRRDEWDSFLRRVYTNRNRLPEVTRAKIEALWSSHLQFKWNE